ncbi:MAG: hypothetical protein Q7K71_07380 [Candidatus Omnitrophota bacterium]|nr:hypothetical protein [Candidatus Omnitrophota bacterium]
MLTVFLINTFGPLPAQAQELVLPKPGVRIALSPEFTPAHLKGITIHQDNALRFDFLIHRGDEDLSSRHSGTRDDAEKRHQYNKLIKYFLASLTVPDKDQWVNLSPYEKDRIIEGNFGKTEMGRDLLGQDYLLKQITASLIYPEEGLGQKFWDTIYERAFKQYGTTNIPVNTFNKVWIIPDKAVVYESGNTAYILQSHLKVMLEEDYLSLEKHTGLSFPNAHGLSSPKSSVGDPGANKAHTLGSQVVREIVLPALEKEVNEGRNFAQLRQIYSAMILATWYKKALKQSLLGQVYADKGKLKGLSSPNASVGDPGHYDIEGIYQQYLKAFKKGVYNYIKEDTDKYTKQIISRKYFSGGFDRAMMTSNNPAALTIVHAGDPVDPAVVAQAVDEAALGHEDSATVDLDPNEVNTTITTGRPNEAQNMVKNRIDVRSQLVSDLAQQEGISLLEAYLKQVGNGKFHEAYDALQLAIRQGKQIIIEIGSGNTNNALALAKKNPEAFILATDEYKINPTGQTVYKDFALDFEAERLSAQKSGSDPLEAVQNIRVVRGFADIVLYLPDATVDSIVLVQPAKEALEELIELIVGASNMLRKLQGASIAVYGMEGLVDTYLELIISKFNFLKQSSPVFKNVDLGKNSFWKEGMEGDLYLATVSDRTAVAKAAKPDAAMMTRRSLLKTSVAAIGAGILTGHQLKIPTPTPTSPSQLPKIPEDIRAQVRELGGTQIRTPEDFELAKDTFDRLLSQEIGGGPLEKVVQSIVQGVGQRQTWMARPEVSQWRYRLGINRVLGEMHGVDYLNPANLSYREPLLNFDHPENPGNRATYSNEGYGIYRYSRPNKDEGFIVATPYGLSQVIAAQDRVITILLPVAPNSEAARWQQAFRDPVASLQQMAEYVNRPFGRNILVQAAYGAPAFAVKLLLEGNADLRQALENKDREEVYAHKLLDIADSPNNPSPLKERMALLLSEMFFEGQGVPMEGYKASQLSGGDTAIRQQLTSKGLTMGTAALIAENDGLLANALRAIIEEYQASDLPPVIGWPTIESARMELLQKLGRQPAVRPLNIGDNSFKASQTDPNTWISEVDVKNGPILSQGVQGLVQFEGLNAQTSVTMEMKGSLNGRPVTQEVPGRLSADGIITFTVDSTIRMEGVTFSISNPTENEFVMRQARVRFILVHVFEPVPTEPLPLPKPMPRVDGTTLRMAVLAASRMPKLTNESSPGGIDMNSANLDLQIKRDGKGVPLPLQFQDMEKLRGIEGFVPVIINIVPVTSLPFLSELQQHNPLPNPPHKGEGIIAKAL